MRVLVLLLVLVGCRGGAEKFNEHLHQETVKLWNEKQACESEYLSLYIANVKLRTKLKALEAQK